VKKISSLRDLNIKRRRALIEFLIREDFGSKGFKLVDHDFGDAKERVTISDGSPILISFDLENASDYKEDAYTWCYVDFFISKPNINLPDDLKRTFTRFLDSRNKRLYWRHRIIVRIIDMDLAVEHILSIKNKLVDMLNFHGVKV